jgi:hypothetical protein
MSFKTFDLAHDVASLQSAINEVVSISASLFVTGAGNLNTKFYTNIATGSGQPALGGYWETVFDSSPASPQSTALFDITVGLSTGSVYYASASVQAMGCANEKSKVYREMASVLLGDPNDQFTPAIGSTPWTECFFILIKRGLMKDELKKGSISLVFNDSPLSLFITGSDFGAATQFQQSNGGDWASLFSGSNTGSVVGQVYYNAGIIVIPALTGNLPWVVNSGTDFWSGSTAGVSPLVNILGSGTMDMADDGLRAHIQQVNFNNQTDLYSTIYFCRATNTEFNYSSNPTYIDSTQRILVTSGSNVLQSRTYITTVGLYDANDNLLAVGKVNKPITKSPDTEAIFRIRLDY